MRRTALALVVCAWPVVAQSPDAFIGHKHRLASGTVLGYEWRTSAGTYELPGKAGVTAFDPNSYVSPGDISISSAARPNKANPEVIWLDELLSRNPHDPGSGYLPEATIRYAQFVKPHPFKVFVSSLNCYTTRPRDPPVPVVAVVKGDVPEDDVVPQEAWVLDIDNVKLVPVPLADITCHRFNKW